MSSRDFGFLTLRNIQAFQSNGNPVPANQVLVTTGSGEAGFTSSLIISSINVSTINASTININPNGDINLLNLPGIANNASLKVYLDGNNQSSVSYALAYTTPFDQPTKLMPGFVEDFGNFNRSNVAVGSLFVGGNTNGYPGPPVPYLTADSNSKLIVVASSLNTNYVNIASSLNVSSINVRHISTFNISVQSTLTFYDSNLSSCVLDTIGSTLYVDGHPVITNAIISTVSSVFW